VTELPQSEIPEYFSVGFTGPPGAGKSTLIDALCQPLCQENKVAVLATDPSSPYSGGALLGDRYRLTADQAENLTYRSLASRGASGNLAEATALASKLMALAGFEWLLLESIGAGQNETEIDKLCHCVVLTLVPEAGDSTQAMKAGILEVADIIVVNKMDRPGASGFYEELSVVMSTRKNLKDPQWQRVILPCTANENKGLSALLSALNQYREHRQKK
jgi:LAO/AO transport system kinase